MQVRILQIVDNHSLDIAYELPQRYVRERLPKRYGEWRARRSTMPGIPFETPVGYGAGARPIGSFPTEGACTGWVQVLKMLEIYRVRKK